MNNRVLAALKFLKASELSYDEWLKAGMALKFEGFGWETWDSFSQDDPRYHSGECLRKWGSFNGSDNPVTGATIIQMAKDRGWRPYESDGKLSWEDEIEYDGINLETKDKLTPAQQIQHYIEVLFKPDDKVSYVTSAWQDKDGKWKPSSSGCYDRTATELMDSLKKYPDDIGATFGDAKPEAGAWIRFNPMDGKGVKNVNVTDFRYALVESDSMSIADQMDMYKALQLPIAVMVHSGGKSLHAIVKIFAKDYQEYRTRVEYLYSFLESKGVSIDRQNCNPSRLSRMPGVMRNGNYQYIVGENIGKPSFEAWMDYAEGLNDELPALVNLSDYRDNPPKQPDELIKGVLRNGHKMLISGSSKAGKSFLLMELCISIAEGAPWLGFPCRKGKVLYVNLEIDPASCVNRFLTIYKKLGLPVNHMDDIVIWNLRGHAIPLDKLVPKLVRRVKDHGYTAVVIDPIYKVITGDENNASDMGYFTNQFDKICSETGCAVIYCHHHSKGAQGMKKAMDRASGSGVFARDPDAQLDMIQLELSDDLKNRLRDGNATAWRLECSLREFANFKPVNFWFEHPIHRVDESGALDSAFTEGSFEAGRARSRKCTTADERENSIHSAYEACSFEQPVTINAMAEYLGRSPRCVRDRLKSMQDIYWVNNGTVGRR